MPAVNSKIVKADYNDIRTKVVTVLGNGLGNIGWGQTARINSSDVAEGTKVTVNEWANLRYDIINAYKHINGSNPTMALVSEGGTVRYTSSFTPDTGTLDVPQKQYDDWINNITTNRFTVAAGESATTSVSTATKTDAWNGTISCTVGFYWNNSSEARWFFNSGGQIRISSARTGGSTSSQNTSWTNLLTAMGTQEFGGNNPGTGTTPSDGLNWYRLTNAFQTYYTGTASSPYGSNNVKLEARVVDVPLNSTGTAAYGEIRCTWTDGYVDQSTSPSGRPFGPDPAGFPPTDLVDGTLTLSVNVKYATGIMVPSNAVFTVANPTIGLGAISSDYTAPTSPTYTPALFLDGLTTYLNAYLSDWRNPGFYYYKLDGAPTSYFTYEQFVNDGVNDLFDSGNFTLPYASDLDGYGSNGTLGSGAAPNSLAARVVKYQTSKSGVTTEATSGMVYKTFGYTDPNIGVNETLQSKGGPESRPLTCIGYKPGSNQTIGWVIVGNMGADGSGQKLAGEFISGSSYNGFTVYAFYCQIYGTSDPSGCSLHMIIGHPRWNSVYGTGFAYAYPTSTDSQNHIAYMTGTTNVISTVSLLSKLAGAAITTAEMTDIVSAVTARMKTYFNF